MYNLFVSGREGSWEIGVCEYRFQRAINFGCFTETSLANHYGSFHPLLVEELKKFPCLFLYEPGCGKKVDIGWITEIKLRPIDVRVSFQIQKLEREIQYSELMKLKMQLDMTKGDENTTHWSLKDVDLLAVLNKVGLIDITDFNKSNNPVVVDPVPDIYQMAYDQREREKETRRKHQLQILDVLARATTPDPASISSAAQLARLEEERRTSLSQAGLALESMSNTQPIHTIINNFHGSHVIQNSPGAMQNVTIGNKDSMETMKQLIPLLTDWAKTANLNATLAADLNSHIQTLNGQITASKPNQTILKEGLKEVWGLIKDVATEVIAAKFKLLLGLTN